MNAPEANPGAEVETAKLTALLDRVERLTANDWFATAPADAGLDQPVLSLSLTLRSGATHEVVFGQTRGKDEDRYVRLPGKDDAFVVAKTSYTSIADALKPLRPGSPSSSATPADSASKLEAASTLKTMPQPAIVPPQPAAAVPMPEARRPEPVAPPQAPANQ